MRSWRGLPTIRKVVSAFLVCLAVSMLLAWIGNRGRGVEGWVGFLSALLLMTGLVWGVWRSFWRREFPLAGQPGRVDEEPTPEPTGAQPRWLAALVLGAVVLRLGAGIVWYLALPVYGHGSPAETAGYVMVDAYTRDQAAWELSQAQAGLWSSLREYRRDDQYGGLLLLSAAFYRYLGGAVHQPLQMVVSCAVFSALSVLFTWGLVRRAWGGKTGQRAATLAAWGLTFYPEAVLQGSSQMREAFTVTLVAAAFYHLFCYFQENRRTSLIWLGVIVAVSLPLSPPLSAALVALLALTAPFIPHAHIQDGRQGETSLPRQGWRRRKYGWWVLAGLLLLVLAGLGAGLEQFGPGDTLNPLELARYWLEKSANLQAFQAFRTSGKLQALFDRLPAWSHILVLVGYGVVQPFLPAALVAVSSASIWQWIAIWRAAGWSVLLALLVYAPVRAWTRRSLLAFILSLQMWGIVLLASFRSGGDQWDNPRYRAAFAALQIGLVAWAWIDQHRKPDPWLRRLLWGVGSVLVWFIPWYLNRYSGLPWLARDLIKTLGLGLATTVLVWIADWARSSPEPQDAEREQAGT